MGVLVRRGGLTSETVWVDSSTMHAQILLDLCEEFLALFSLAAIEGGLSIKYRLGVTWVSEPLKLFQEVKLASANVRKYSRLANLVLI